MKLSIVIPIYNVEKYLDKCLESIYTLENIDKEVILINDGSTDKSLEIINKYYEKNKDITVVINRENRGVSFSRNEGIKKSRGDYIYFLDSDDWIETKSFEKMVVEFFNQNKTKEEVDKIDVLLGKEYSYKNNEREIIDNIPKKYVNREIKGKDYLEMSIKERFWNVRIPIGIYSRSLILNNNIYFLEETTTNEDEVFIMKIFYYSRKIKISDEIIGYYRMRENSIMSNFNISHPKDIFYNTQILIKEFSKEKDLKLKKVIFSKIKRYYQSALSKAAKLNEKELFNNIHKQFKEDCKKHLFKISLAKYENIVLIFIYYFKDTYYFIKNKRR